MISIDKYAYMSKLKKTAPMKKLVFSLLTLGVCLWADSAVTAVLILLTMSWLTVCKGGIPPAAFMRLMLLPVSFLFIGVFTVAVSISGDESVFLLSVSAFGTNIGVAQAGLQSAARLFFKALGAVSCMYYLSLNTPVVDLLAALRRLRVPKLIIEIMGLMYRFIFILLGTADTIFTAQNSRLGYANLSSGYRSLGSLAAALFLRSYKRSEVLYTALEARGYDGELNVLEERYETRWTEYIGPVATNMVFITIALLLKMFTGEVY